MGVAVDVPDVGMPFSFKYACTPWLIRSRLSLFPHASQRSLICLFAASGSATRSAGGFVLGAEEKPPIQANLSRCASPKLSVWPTPMERPARARCSRSACTEYFDSIAGIKSSRRSFSNAGAEAKTFPSA